MLKRPLREKERWETDIITLKNIKLRRQIQLSPSPVTKRIRPIVSSQIKCFQQSFTVREHIRDMLSPLNPPLRLSIALVV